MTQNPTPPIGLARYQARDALVALARDIAAGINELPMVLDKHSLTEAEYEIIRENKYFAAVVEAERAAFHSPSNVDERLRIQAAHALEDFMVTLCSRINDRTEELTSAIAGGQLLAKIAGITERKQNTGPSDKFMIQINLGADKQIEFVKDINPQAQEKPDEKLRQISPPGAIPEH